MIVLDFSTRPIVESSGNSAVSRAVSEIICSMRYIREQGRITPSKRPVAFGATQAYLIASYGSRFLVNVMLDECITTTVTRQKVLQKLGLPSEVGSIVLDGASGTHKIHQSRRAKVTLETLTGERTVSKQSHWTSCANQSPRLTGWRCITDRPICAILPLGSRAEESTCSSD